MQVKQIWTGVSVVTPDGVLRKDLTIEGDRFGALCESGALYDTQWHQIEGQGQIIFPGIIDLLQHGYNKFLYNDVEPGCVAQNSKELLAHGVTGFLPSISSLPPDSLHTVLSSLAREVEEADSAADSRVGGAHLGGAHLGGAHLGGARALGIHSEGPCFGSPGAHNPENLQVPSLDLARMMLDASTGTLKAVTVAPELPGAEDFIKLMKKSGVSVHLGHSMAKPEDVARYVSWGIDAVTHVYNVMPGLPPRQDGVYPFSLVDALLAEPGLALGLICDGIHVHPQLVKLLAQLPPDRLFLETDAIKFAGGKDTEFEFYPGYWVTSAKGKAVRDRNGGLCGSSLTPHEALLNYLDFSGQDLARAAIASSLVPARILGMDHELGSIEPGKLADFCVLDPRSLAVNATYIAGRQVFRRSP